jgi:hypothetical protein
VRPSPSELDVRNLAKAGRIMAVPTRAIRIPVSINNLFIYFPLSHLIRLGAIRHAE